MKQIPVSNSAKVVLVDDEDYMNCCLHRWEYTDVGVRSINSIGGQTRRSLAGFIMNDYENIYDHKDRDTFNNQKLNLRIANHSQNKANSAKYDRYNGTDSQYKGVSLNMSERSKSIRWKARIRVNKKLIYLGTFANEKQAALAYNEAAIKYYGEFACLNKL